MQNSLKVMATIMLIVALSAAGCKKDSKTAYDIPVVETSPIHEITGTSALGGGVVVSASGGEIIERGVCWGLQSNPTIEGNHASAGTGIGTFVRGMSNLEQTTTYHVRAYATNSVGVGYGPDVTFTTTLEHGYVDFGLPSGLLWATCNVGANSPEEYGDYFAWGDTEPRETNSTNPWEAWAAYKYGCGFYTVSKYTDTTAWNCSTTVDHLMILEPCDDAATANWGNGWRMPTAAEWVEMINNANSIWTTRNGVEGMLYMAMGDTLFLPAAGLLAYDQVVATDSLCYYWTSTRMSLYHYDALIYGRIDGNHGNTYYSRCDGLPVRPVRDGRKR